VHAPVYGDTDVDNAYVTIALGDAAATVNLSRTSTFGMDIRCEVVGPGGTIRLSETAVGGGLAVLSSASSGAFPEDCRSRFPDAYQAQMDAFARACRGRRPTAPRWRTTAGRSRRRWPRGRAAPRGERLEVGPSWDWNPAARA
jgi:predicted dehydrogenase